MFLGLALLLLIGAGLCYLSAAGIAALECVRCDCSYDWHRPGCRTPMFYLAFCFVMFGGSVLAFIIGIVKRRSDGHRLGK